MSPTCARILVLALCILQGAGAVAESLGSLVMGVFPRRDPAVTIQLFRPLAEHLGEATGYHLSLETAPNFEVFEGRLHGGRYDLVHLNQYHYIRAHRDLDYQALVQNEEFGAATIRGVLYVRRDSGIQDVAQLQGRTVLFGGGPQAMMSYIVPTFLLRQGGLQEGDYRERFAVTPPDALIATWLGHADAAGAGEVVQHLPLVTAKIDPGELRVLAVSEPLAHLPWAVRGSLPAAVRDSLRAAFLGLEESPAGREVLRRARLTGFNPATDRDYDPHRRMVDGIHGGP
jgi:phosphonate transport system substrate-binding protein